MTQPPQNPGPGAASWGPQQDHPRATIVLVLGILGLVLCQLLAPVAWIMGNTAVREIDESGGRYGGRGSAQAGRICGIIGTVLLVLSIVFLVGFVVLLAASGNS
jgi:uncharacterized membrane protein YjgN (DUF898 family)